MSCRIYVACLAAYNAGHLHGRWIDATTPDAVRAQVSAMLAASPEPGSEEWAIHDHEGFEGADISEYASFEYVCALAEFIEKHGELGGEVLAHFGGRLDEARTAMEEQYAGQYASAADWIEEFHNDTGTEIPEALKNYIDWQAMARDMALNSEIFEIMTEWGVVHIFWSR